MGINRRHAIATATALLALAAPSAALADDPPPPGLPPIGGSAEPATDSLVPSAPAGSTDQQAQQQTQQDPPKGDPGVGAPQPSGPTGPGPKSTKGSKVIKPKCKAKKHGKKHAKHPCKTHKKHKKHGRKMHGADYNASVGTFVQCDNDQGQDEIYVQEPNVGIDSRLGSQYIAYEPVYTYWDGNTWQYGGQGPWMWTLKRAGQVGAVWHNFNDNQPNMFTGTSVNASGGAYWRVAMRIYWYPSGSVSDTPAYDWITNHHTHVLGSDIFSEALNYGVDARFCYPMP
jgi:hypothetical protein